MKKKMEEVKFADLEKPNPMDVYFGVFNTRETDMRKARKAFIEKYGKEAFEKQIKIFLKQGIMSIFSKKPNRFTRFYAKRLTDIGNARRLKNYNSLQTTGKYRDGANTYILKGKRLFITGPIAT